MATAIRLSSGRPAGAGLEGPAVAAATTVSSGPPSERMAACEGWVAEPAPFDEPLSTTIATASATTTKKTTAATTHCTAIGSLIGVDWVRSDIEQSFREGWLNLSDAKERLATPRPGAHPDLCGAPKFGVSPPTRQHGACANIRHMERRLIVELDRGSPPSGRVVAPDGSSTRFAGWTELAQALQPDFEGGAEAGGDPPAGESERG
jgi:hypothetical protein